MYQLYKDSVRQDVSDFIPLIMRTITLQPSLEQRQAETFNKEIFVDFMGAQIKTLSFLAYIIKIYEEHVQVHSELMVKGMLGLLKLCPMEVAHLRRELLIAARHILATDLRKRTNYSTIFFKNYYNTFYQILCPTWRSYSMKTCFWGAAGQLTSLYVL